MKPQLTYLIFLIVLFLSVDTFAQIQGQQQIDSVLRELPKITSDTAKINAWCGLSKGYGNINPDSGIFYANLALAKARQLKWPKGEVVSLNMLAINYFRNSTYDKSLNFAFESISNNIKLKDSSALASSYHVISMTYMKMGDFVKALKYVQDELKILEALKDKRAIASAYNTVGIIYHGSKKYQEALEYYNKALVAATEVNDKRIISYAYSNSGIIYQYLNQFSKALDYQFMALKIEEELGDIYGMGTEYGSISSAYMGIYLEQKKNNKATSNMLIDSAIYYANKGIEYCKKCDDLIDAMSITFSLSEAYKLKEDYKTALEVYMDGSKLKDSIFSAENQTKIREVEMKQQELLNEKEMQLLQTQKKLERNYYLSAGTLLLLFSIAIFSRLQVVRRTKKKLEEKNDIISNEKKRSDDLLLNILPAEVADELKLKGSADARQFNEVTVMFTDFKGFTQISEKLTAKELVEEIHTCFMAFDNIISKHNIEKIKTIGDSHMRAGGLPVANKTHAVDVVSAALEIQQFMQMHSEKRKSENKEIFEIRIGIHTGNVVAGIVGIKKFAYDIWGDTVNIASRMESSGEAGKVNISDSTFELVKDKFVCIHRGKIQAKHKGEVDMYFVEGFKSESYLP